MGLGLGLWERNPPHSPLSSLPGATIPQSLVTHLLTWSRLGWEEAEPGTPGASGQLWAEKGQGDGRMGCGARKKRGVGWGRRLLKVRATLRRDRAAIQAPTRCLGARKRGGRTNSFTHSKPLLLRQLQTSQELSTRAPGISAFPQVGSCRAAPWLR